MAWGGGTITGGAPMGGSVGGSPGNPGNGLPFAGIPWEMRQGVEKLLADEPDLAGDARWEASEKSFTHRMQEAGISLRRMLRPHRRMLAALDPLHRGRGVVRPGRAVPQPEGHRRRHHPPRLDRPRHHRHARHPRCRRLGDRERSAGRDHRARRVAGDVRAAGAHLRAPATPLARLLHRREGGRDHDPHDERHRVAPAAPAGRPAAVRAAGAHHGHRHRRPLLLQRRAHAHHAADDRAPPHRPVALVPLIVRQGLPARARRHRRRVERPLGEPVRRAGRHRLQPGPPQRAAAPQRRPASTATPTTTPPTSPRPTARAPSSSVCSVRRCCC